MRVRRTPNPPRRGMVEVLETAIVLPVVMMLTFGTWSTAMGVYYYQLVASLAREGARYASVHGTQYAADTGNSAATPADIYNNAILPMAMAVGLTPSHLIYAVIWNTTNSPYNSVIVTVTYQWTPDLYITGPLNLTSTSVMPMSY
ncbi:MAG: TadE family protein [Isosphaeraceae bacterium]